MKEKYHDVNTVKYVKNFYIKTNRIPKYIDFRENDGLYYWEHFKKNKLEITKRALHGDGLYVSLEPRTAYSEEELLRFLVSFEKHHGRKPSVSDCKRGLLPPHQRYSYNFGSWKAALLLAFS
jgi:hypothetical protein